MFSRFKLNNFHFKLVVIAVLIYLVIFFGLSFWKDQNFFYNALDLAIINQAFYNSANGQFFASSIHPPTYLIDHFSPILILLLPFYLFWQTPSTLLFLQTLFLALSAVPLYLIAKNNLTKNWAAVVSLAWLFNPFVHNANLFEFSFLPVAVFFIFWTIYFYQKQNFWPFLFFGFLALLAREDVSLVILMFGFLALVEKRKIYWRLAPIIFSGAYFILALNLISFFAVGQNYKFLIYYSWLGQNFWEILKNSLTNPLLLISHLLKFNNLEFILGLLLPTGFIILDQSKYLILGLLIFFQLALRQSGASVTLLQTYYSILLLPAIFWALILSLKKINSLASKEKKNLLIIIFFTAFIYSFLTLSPLLPALKKISQAGLLVKTSQIQKDLIKIIPPHAAVAATYNFLTPLSSREKIYSFNYAFLGKQQFLSADYALPRDTEYLVLDFSEFLTYQFQYGNNPIYQPPYEKSLKTWPQILTDFGLIKIKNNFALFQKGTANKFELIKKITAAPVIQSPTNLIFDDQINFLGFNQINNQYQLFWEINPPINHYYLNLKLIKNDQTSDQKIYPLAYGLLTDAGEKQIIQTNHWFYFNDLPPGSYQLKADLATISAGGVEIDAIRSTKNVIDQMTQLGPTIDLGEIKVP
ncbi:MAG TPA: DUF2079 domain-containing protein [Patescibacteria group bacterium]|nr:DUF2079 domain-containing protein [Patescibacteria group bacterium]